MPFYRLWKSGDHAEQARSLCDLNFPLSHSHIVMNQQFFTSNCALDPGLSEMSYLQVHPSERVNKWRLCDYLNQTAFQVVDATCT